jgi:transposase-like protein
VRFPDGREDVLGIWIEQTRRGNILAADDDGDKNRGVNDILIAIVDGLKALAATPSLKNTVGS